MKLFKKVTVVTGLILLVGSSNLFASTYTVKAGDTLSKITYKLGFHSIEEAHFKVPSGDINKIFPGDTLIYKSKRHKRFVARQPKIDLDKFCFKDSRSIHYRAVERCR